MICLLSRDRPYHVFPPTQNPEAPIATYAYDPFGRRLWKEVAGKRVYFLYSDEGLIGEYDDKGREIKVHGYKPGSVWTTDPVFMRKEGQYYFYHNDHLGTPQRMTKRDGAIVWSAKFSSFGKIQIKIDEIGSNLRFSGQYEDVHLGLYYNWKRYYDSKTGRYIRRDPYKGDISDPSTLSLYPYCMLNPIINKDELGLSCAPICVPIEWDTDEKKVYSEEETWLTSANILCYY